MSITESSFPVRRAALGCIALAASLALPAAGCSAQARNSARNPAKAAADDPAFGAKVRAYLMEHPEVIQDAMNRLQDVQAQKLAMASATAIADNRKAIEADARDPVGGARAAPVTVTEFFDYRCPYCKVAAPALPAYLARHSNVRFVYKEFPILSEMSEHAAKAALAAKLQGKYEAVHGALMATSNLTDETIDDALKAQGLDVAKAHKDAESPEIKAQIEDVRRLARTLNVGGTPAFIVGDKVSNGWVPDELDQYIALAEKPGARKTASVSQ